MIATFISLLVSLGAKPIFGTVAFPYRGPVFDSFVADSYRVFGRKNPSEFYSWFENAAVKAGMPDGLVPTLQARKAMIVRANSPAKKAELQLALAAEIHRTVKKAIPRFSLDRGFEFVQTVQRGERQCFLQSVLVSGLLQRAGVDSGVAMVWRNIAGQSSNNAHAVAVERLANGRDLIVDCSEPEPFPRHQGLFVADGRGSYRFVSPRFFGSSSDISGYGGTDAHGLDIPFLRSQFDYYRGERVPGGFLGKPRAVSQLMVSEMYLKKAVEENPNNPLAEYVLGHVYRMEGRTELAKKQYLIAYGYYRRFGWLAPGVAASAGK